MFWGEGSGVFSAALVWDAGQVGVPVMFGVEVTIVLVMLSWRFCEGGVGDSGSVIFL